MRMNKNSFEREIDRRPGDVLSDTGPVGTSLGLIALSSSFDDDERSHRSSRKELVRLDDVHVSKVARVFVGDGDIVVADLSQDVAESLVSVDDRKVHRDASVGADRDGKRAHRAAFQVVALHADDRRDPVSADAPGVPYVLDASVGELNSADALTVQVAVDAVLVGELPPAQAEAPAVSVDVDALAAGVDEFAGGEKRRGEAGFPYHNRVDVLAEHGEAQNVGEDVSSPLPVSAFVAEAIVIR